MVAQPHGEPLARGGVLVEVGGGGGAPQRLPDHALGGDRGAEQAGGDARDLLALVLEGTFARQRGRSADALEALGAARVADTAAEHRDVGPLASPVGVQLVEDEEAEILGGRDEVTLGGPREQQLEHHVVGQEDVGRVTEDLFARLLVLLAGVAAERHRRLALRVSMPKELLELAGLRVGQGVHWIDDDRLDASVTGRAAQDGVDDRDDVGEALARTGPGGQDVGPTGRRHFDGVCLMAVQAERLALARALVLGPPEDPAALGVQLPAVDQLIDPGAGLEGGVELEPRLGPQQPLLELLFHILLDPLVTDRQEALGVGAVVRDQAVAQGEDVQDCSPSAGGGRSVPKRVGEGADQP